MTTFKTIISAVLFIVPTLQYGQHTDQINSNRPGETMSAFAVGKSVVQVETGVFGIQESHSTLNYDAMGMGLDLSVRWGVLDERLEVIGDFQYQYETFDPSISNPDKSAMKQTIIGAKYLLYDPFKGYKRKINIRSWKANHSFNWRQFIPAVSAFAGANFTFEDNPYYFSSSSTISPKLMLITQNHLGNGSWVFVTNFYADYIGTIYPTYGYGITLTKGFNTKWSGFVENQGFMSDFYSDTLFRGGAAYLIHKNLQVDVSISTNIKDTPSILYGGIGCSWRYDAKYKEVELKPEDMHNGNDEKDKIRKKAIKRAKKTKRG